MSESKHTPRPWYVDGLLFIGVDKHGNGRGSFRLQTDDDDPYPEEEVEANQQLCASAPELLEACEEMLHRFGHLDTDPGKREACSEARAAIAKATET